MGNDDSPRPGFDHWVAMPGQGEAIDPSLNVDGQRVQAKGYTTDLLTDYVERFIDRPSDAPFLVYLAHKAIHPNVIQNDDGSLTPLAGQPGGFVAAERHRGRYAGRPMPRRANAFAPPLDKPALMRRIDRLPPLGKATATTDEEIRGRLEMLLAVDDSLGRIRAILERKGVARRHGRSSSPATTATSTASTASTRSAGWPTRRRSASRCIVRYPRLATAGSTPAAMALSLDLAPTLLEVAGLHAGAADPGPFARAAADRHGEGLAHVVPGRVLQRHGVPAHPHHGLRGGADRPAQVHPVPRAAGDGRALRPRGRSLRDDQPRRQAGSGPGAAADARRTAAPARRDEAWTN